MTEAEVRINAIYKKNICKRFPNEYEKPISIHNLRESKKGNFNSKLFSSREEYQCCKVHYMFKLQTEYLEKAKEAMQKYAKSEKMEFEKTDVIIESEPKSGRIKTDLSISQLAYIFNIFISSIARGDYNKRKLAEIISDNFETERIKNPSKDQVYKRIFDNNESNNKAAKGVIISMMNTNSSKSV